MASVSLSADVKKLSRKLNRLEKKQIPYALSLTINDLAFQSRKAEVWSQAKQLDRPTPFTQKGFRVTKATKSKLVAVLSIPDNRWKYIKHAVSGGSVSKGGPGHAIAVNQSLNNKYGGLPRNKAKNLTKRGNHFSAKINGTEGIWKRGRSKATRRQLSLQMVFKQTISVPRKYKPWKATIGLVKAKFSHVMKRNLSIAMRTAR